MDYESNIVANRVLRPTSKPHSAREVHAVKFKATLDDQVALNNLIGLAVLPEYCLPIDLEMYLADLDGGTALVWNAGILNVDGDDLVSNSLLVSASTVGQSAGIQRVNTFAGIHEPGVWLAEADAPAIEVEKIVAMMIATAPGTSVAGNVYGVLKYIASEYDL